MNSIRPEKRCFRQIILFFGFCLATQYTLANVSLLAPSETNLAFVHLLEINKTWADWEQELPNGLKCRLINFENDNERIQFHFYCVDMLLSTKGRFLAPTTAQKRKKALADLSEYALEGKFPVNRKHQTRTPYFLDHEGTSCAVRHMMVNNEASTIAEQIDLEFNNGYVRDFPAHWYNDWMQESGFTPAELELIQPAYPPPVFWENLAPGISDGKIWDMTVWEGQLFVVGDFTFMGQQMKIAKWNGSSFVNLLELNEGTPKHIQLFQNKIYIGVEETSAEPILIFDGDTFQTSTGLASENSSVFDFMIHENEIFACGSKSLSLGHENFILKETTSGWELGFGDVEGYNFHIGGPFEHVMAIASHNNDIFIGGNFSSYTINGVEVPCRHGLRWTGSGFHDLDFEPEIFDLESAYGELWAGGSYAEQGQVYAALACWNCGGQYDFNWYGVPNNAGETGRIVQLRWMHNELYAFGCFEGSSKYVQGGNAAKITFDPNGTHFWAVPLMSSGLGAIYTGLFKEEELFIGGSFQLGSLRIFASTTYVDTSIEMLKEQEFSIFPNPARSDFFVEPVGNGPFVVQVFNQTGNMVLSENCMGKTKLSIDHLSSGLYFVRKIEGSQTQMAKLMVAAQ